MQRQSAPTERVLQVFDAFRQAPGQPLSLANVVERTGLAPATCLGILNTLRQRGFLVRPGDAKTFVLGPGAIALGVAAQSAYAAVELAREAMRQLSETWQCPCTASAIIDDHVTVLARAGPQMMYEHSIEVGRRYPLRPPVGILNLVWYPDARIQQWLRTPHVLPVRQDRKRLELVIAAARARGYVVERSWRTIDFDAIAEALGQDRIPPKVAELLSDYATTLGERDYIAEELDGFDVLQVASLSAPVYDEAGSPVMLVLLYLLRDEMDRTELERAGDELLAATADITRQLGGFDPWARA